MDRDNTDELEQRDVWIIMLVVVLLIAIGIIMVKSCQDGDLTNAKFDNGFRAGQNELCRSICVQNNHNHGTMTLIENASYGEQQTKCTCFDYKELELSK